MENYYKILEVDKNASQDIISKIFKYHIKKNHPDLFDGDEKIEAEKKVKKYNEAYDILSNPEKRKEYDQMLEETENEQYSPINEANVNLTAENSALLHRIKCYDRFIHEYFYERANEVYNVIDSYDNTDYYHNKDTTYNNKYNNSNKIQSGNIIHNNISENSNNNSTLKNYITNKLKILLFYIIIGFIIIFALSISLRVNIFKILFDAFTH